MYKMISQCDHNLTDDIEGFNTCLLCGLVLHEQSYVMDFGSILESSGNEIKSEKSCKMKKNRNKNDFCLLKEMYERDFFSFEVLQLSKSYIKKWAEDKIPFSKFHCAYAVYFSSKKLNFPILIHQISSFLNISLKDIYRLEKIIPCKESILPSKYVNKFGGILNIPYSDIKQICYHVDHLISTTNISPICLAISMIYSKIPNLEIKTLSAISYTSIPSIVKWKTIFEKQELTNKKIEKNITKLSQLT